MFNNVIFSNVMEKYFAHQFRVSAAPHDVMTRAKPSNKIDFD